MYNQKSGLIWKPYLKENNYIEIDCGYIKFQDRFSEDISKRVKLLRNCFICNGSKITQQRLHPDSKDRISLIENNKKPKNYNNYLTEDIMYEIVDFFLKPKIQLLITFK